LSAETTFSADAVLSALAALTALFAAAFWFLSAKLPVHTPGTYWDGMREDDQWLVTTRRAANLNKWAAFCAGLSALCTSAIWFVK